MTSSTPERFRRSWFWGVTSVHNLRSKLDECYSAKSLPGVCNNIAGIENILRKKDIQVNTVLDKKPVNNGLTWRCGLTPNGSFTVNALRLRLFLRKDGHERNNEVVSGEYKHGRSSNGVGCFELCQPMENMHKKAKDIPGNLLLYTLENMDNKE
ncbi:unnamed protein product [Lactuca saligna]|uniref:Uncharacterized protein n=1 Tax=Lactuca saligna TaxID=75948 RepID=A0AA36E269_LACSI|nr:unnamed protein product [Lactuca saligna]